MTASPRGHRVAAALLTVLIPLLLTACNLFTVPDTVPRCPSSYPGATLEPTPVSLPGTVRFGTSINPNLTVRGPRTTFGIHEMVAWIAHFSHPLRSGQVTFQIRRDECGRWVRVYASAPLPYNPGLRYHTRGILPALRLEYRIIHPGTYQVRYLDTTSVIAAGTVRLAG